MQKAVHEGSCAGDVLSWDGLLSKTHCVSTHHMHVQKSNILGSKCSVYSLWCFLSWQWKWSSGVEWGEPHPIGKGELQPAGAETVLLLPKSRRCHAFMPGTALHVLQIAHPTPKIFCSHLLRLEKTTSRARVCIYRERQGCSQERIPFGRLRRYILVTVPIHSNNMNWNEISATHLIQHISISDLYFVKNIESIIQSLQ